MNSAFYFHSPVTTYINFDFDNLLIDMTKDYDRITIISGRTSIIKTGFKDKIINILKHKNLNFFSEIEENPSINTIIKGGKTLKKHKTEIIIAFGGGSVLDAAKAIGLFAKNQGSFYEILNSNELNPALPVIAIPTTSGTGSEMNNYAIITDTENKDKINIAKESMFPKAAILEPIFLQTLSKELLKSTVFDAFSHSFEGCLSASANPFSDLVALQSIEIILKTVKNTNNFENISYDDLKNFLYASSLAGIVILHTKTTLLHALGYYLTNHKNIHHGKTNAMLFPYYLKLCKNEKIKKLNEIDKLFNQYEIMLENFSEIFCGKIDIKNIISDEEADEFINYAVNKSNSKNCLFKVEFDMVKQVLYP